MAAQRGVLREDGCEVRLKKAQQADLADLRWCDAVMFGTPENFGFMSGMLKDFFDRTYYPAQPYQLNLPYGVFVAAGNDGTGALRQVRRILKGYPMREVAEPVILRTGQDPGSRLVFDPSGFDASIQQVEDMGQALAAGLVLGIF